MMSWKDVMMAQEHNKDLLREAEEARLIQQLSADDKETGLWQKVKELFFRMNEDQGVAEDSIKTSYLPPVSTD